MGKDGICCKKTAKIVIINVNFFYRQVVAEEYLKLFDFNGCSLDEALRVFLSRFCLAGETQERERVIYAISSANFHYNTDVNTSKRP